MENQVELIDVEFACKLVEYLEQNFPDIKPQNFFVTMSFILGQFAHNHCSDMQIAMKQALFAMHAGHKFEAAQFEQEFGN